ncbi:MAG: hypothetical protein LBH13_08430, partial [Cellulomonadaceae bacterium]|nr:hypothetical protein [Cellulomonadaceae bacterium]
MKTRIRILCASVVASALALGGALTGVPAFADETSWLQQALDEVPDRTSATIQVPPSKCGPEVQGPITLSGGKSVRLDLNGCDLTIIGNVALTIENGAKLELVGETPTVGLHVKSTGGNALLVDGNSVATVTSASAGAAGNNVDVRDGSKLTITGEVTGDNGILATDTGTQVTVGSIKVEKSPVQAYVGAKVTVDDDVTVTSPDDTTHISTSAGSVVNVGGRYLATSSGGSASASAVSGSTITLNESVSGHYVVFEADGFNSKVSTIGGTVTATQGVRAEATNSAIIQVNSPINAKDNVTVLAEESASVTLGGAVNVADGSLNLDTRPS